MLLLAAGPLALLAVGQMFWSARALKRGLRDQYVQRAVSVAAFYQSVLKESLDLGQTALFLSSSDRVRRTHPDIRDVRLYALRRGAFVPFSLEGGISEAAGEVVPAEVAGGAWVARDDLLQGRPVISVFYPIMILGQGAGALELRLSTEQLDRQVRRLVVQQVAFSLLVLLAVVGVSILVADLWITRRIIRLERQISVYGTGAEDDEPPDAAPDEIGALSRAFARMKLESRRAQAQLLSAEKLTAVGRLSAGVAHEINNPVGIILGFAQSMRSRLKPGDPLALPVQSIAREAERCKTLVQSLLQFSRGGAAEHREELDVNAVVDEALALVQVQGTMARVEIVKKLGPDLPRIRANRIQLQQVVVNIGGNAVDAMPQGGVLTVETAASGGGAGVVLRISDTGTGIPAEIRSKIFDPFFTTKEVGKGTGLGLALVHEIVHKHGGRIEFESEVGRGTAFRVIFPAAS